MDLWNSLLARVPARSRRAVVMATLLFGSVFSYLLISRIFFSMVEVEGRSMEPTLWPGQMRFLHRWEMIVSGPQRFAVVAFRDPLDDELSVKRVIGLPGDTVDITEGMVLVNGRPLEEAYLASGTRTLPYEGRPVRFRLGGDWYFLLGDNRSESVDGRVYGGVHRKRMLGVIHE